MESLKSFLITRLLIVVGAVCAFEAVLLIPIRQILLPLAAYFGQMKPAADNLTAADIARLLYSVFSRNGESAVLGLLARSQVFLLLLAAAVLVLAPIAAGVLIYSWLVAMRVNEIAARRDAERMAYEARRNLMISDFAHDLRTPITTIAGYAGALADGMVTEPEQKKEYLEAIRRKSVRMTELINLLFDYVRLGSADFHLNKKDWDINALAAEVAASLYTDAEDAGMDLGADIPEEPFIVCADRGQVSRILHNLIINAIRHNPAGTQIEVRVRRMAGAELIAVADSGEPIPSDAGNLFEPFVKGDKSRTGDTGSGLGLSIAKKVTEMHGWELGIAQPYEGHTKAFVLKVTEK